MSGELWEVCGLMVIALVSECQAVWVQALAGDIVLFLGHNTYLSLPRCINGKVWVQMNVVPRSTGNTNSGTRELTLKCKLKRYFKPMNNPLGVSPSKGKQGTTRG